MHMDTVFALSSGSPPAGIAVIRVSGPAVATALESLCGGPTEPRRATRRRIVDPYSGEPIDEGLVLFFPGPDSFTGEDVAELHVHGGRAVVSRTLAALGALEGCRPAERGEFTRRAFVNGRLDLSAAEGIGDLIAADTEAQRRAALAQMQGSIRKQYESWAASLLRARGLLEAEIDFSEEEGLGRIWSEQGRSLAIQVRDDLEQALAAYDKARAIREGLEIMLVGSVNVGKSTLLNVLAGRDIAIVSPEAGTTRDLIEVTVDLGGFKVTFVDGAGLRESDEAIESEGIRRVVERARSVDLLLWLRDGPDADGLLIDTDREIWSVATKGDLEGDEATIRLRNESGYVISARTEDGVPALMDAIGRWAANRASGAGEILVSRERHRSAVREALSHMELALGREEAELAAEELRVAGDALGRLTGRVDADDVLDIVFGEFCIGK